MSIQTSIRYSLAAGLFTLATGALVLCSNSASSQEGTKKDSPPAKLDKLDLDQSKFMRKKLEASSQILEGLTTENSELVRQGARVLSEMSSAEKWQVKNDVMYRQFSGEFQRSATGLLEAAEKNNFDAATLKWIDTTMKCIECHKFVRGARIVGNH